MILQEYWSDVKPPARTRPDRTYEGRRDGGKCKVRVSGRPLASCLGIMNHSPSGFEWGYSGTHQRFKAAVVVNLPHDNWTLTRQQVLDMVARLEGGDRGGNSDDP